MGFGDGEDQAIEVFHAVVEVVAIVVISYIMHS